MSATGFVLELIRRFPLLMLGATVLLVAESTIGTVAVFTVAPIIDFIMSPDVTHASPVTQRIAGYVVRAGLPATLATFLGVFLGFQILKNSATILVRYYIFRGKYVVLRDLMVGTFQDFFDARWAFFGGVQHGTLFNTFMREITVVGDAFGAMALFFANLFRFTFYIVVPFYLSWQVTSISLITAVVLVTPFLLLGKLNHRLGRLNTETGNAMGAVIHESLSLAKVILGFGNPRRSVQALADTFDAHRRVTVKSQTLRVATPLMYEPLGVFVLVVAVLTAQRVHTPVGEMAVLLWALHACVPLLGDLMAQKNSLLNFVPSYEQVRRLQRQARDVRQRSGTRAFEGFSREVAVEHVTFAHPDHEPVLVDVTVRIPKGRMVAIVGESGTGKSTLVDVLMGFNDPAAGRVSVDGTELGEFDVNSYRRRIGYVPQESVLFNVSIRDNLLWASASATEPEIREACRQANASEFIERFPEGYDTIVGDRGVRLSVGQCQRIALARAILRHPDLLVLDEATSALDTQSERLIQRAIESVARDTTVIVIAHRLSTIVNADRIYVLHRGRVVEEGAYDELVARGGHFARMTQLQVLEAVR
jgi:ATP-binding cassette subfamily B protein